MKRFITTLIIIAVTGLLLSAQQKQASSSAALRSGKRTIELINGLSVEVDFDIEKEHIWFNGSTSKSPLFITEYIPLDNPNNIGIEVGKSYKLDNLFVSIEYKILEIQDNKVTRIWFRIAALQLKLPEESFI